MKKDSVMKKLFKYIGKYWILLILSIILAGISVVLQLYVPVLFGNAIDEIVAAHNVDFTQMWLYLKQILLFVVIAAAAIWIMNLVNNRMTYHIVQDIRSQAIRHIQKLPLSYLDQHSTGDIVSRIIADTDILSDGLLLGFTQLFSGVVTVVVTLIFMFSKNVWITLMVILLTPLSFLVAKFISSRSFTMFKKQSETRGKQTALIEEMIGNQKVVQAFGYENRSSERFAAINEELRDASQKAVFYSSLTNPSTRFVNNIIYACVALVGAFIIPGGRLTVGGLSVLLSYANQYMSWYLTGTAFALISAGMNQFIICQGFATVGMKSVVLGAVSNIVLDPVFIFVMNMGVRGAAIATVLSQMASCIYVLLFLFGKRPLVRITFGGYRWKTMKQVLLVGLSPFLIIASDSLLIIVMNMVISSYGGPERSDMLLTCNTIVQSFMLIITMPLGGITGGTQTVMGYNYGAGRPDRIRKAEKHILLLSVAFTTVMFIIAQAGPGYFVRIFTREMSYVRVTEWAIRIFTLCIIPLAVEYTVVDGFTGMGIAKVAISLSMFRKSVYFLGMILLPRYFGVEAVFYAEPISDIMACAAASTTFIMLSGKVLKDNRRLF